MTIAEDPVAPPEPEPESGAPQDDPQRAELRQAVLDGLEAMKLPTTGSVVGDPATGEITIACSSRSVLLPRPNFKQIRTLIRAEEHLASQLQNLRYRSSARLNKFYSDVKQFEGEAGVGNIDLSPDNVPGLIALRDESRIHADEIEDERDADLTTWWTLVFATLLPGAAPAAPTEDEWPADLLDAGLPGRVIAHWRRNPVGPG